MTGADDMSGLSDLSDMGWDDVLAWDPMRLAPPDPWVGHIPFAFWLIKALKPATTVELGTHSGNSYFAFCQALASVNYAARAFAVDTWEGDEHAGFYGGDIFQDVFTYNKTHFGNFSTLLRTTFDDARSYFPDGGIDLLHIDGLHSYEAVLHDFENWKAALSNRAVVLFHDTNVREREFGVWRLWKDLSAQYPSFEFSHSNGLGVLGVGSDQAPLLQRLFNSNTDEQLTASIRRSVSLRGEAFRRQVEVMNLTGEMQRLHEQVAKLVHDANVKKSHVEHRALDLENQLKNYKSEVQAVQQRQSNEIYWRDTLLREHAALISTKDELIRIFQNLAAAREATTEARDALILARDNQLAQLMSDLREQARRYDDQIARMTQEHLESEANHRLAAENSRLTIENDVLRQTDVEMALAQAAESVASIQARLQAQLDATIQAYQNSTSWKITRPLRVAMRFARTGRLRHPRPTQPADHQGMGMSVLPHDNAAAVPAPVTPGALQPAEPGELAGVEVASDGVLSGGETDANGEMSLKAAMRGMLMAKLTAFLSGSEVLSLRRAEAPDVSIILVLYNQAELTFACLSSIVETLGQSDYGIEVIIVDNNSTDLTVSLLDRIDGATVIRNGANLHFLKAVNLATKSVRGQNILLLNNDAQLLPGSLASALRTLRSSPDIGAVGGRIILPDGTLQEAGSIIWRDGACSGYGRGQDPTNPDFMFQRDVDYCSGAFLLTPTDLFRKMDGFNEQFAPAYYEETDYCVRLWESGYRVVYDPDAAIIHYEFGSASATSAALELQAANHKIFVSRHAEWLSGQFFASPLNVMVARAAQSQAPRILVIEDRVPKIELGTGYPRANRLLHELVSAGADVTLFPVWPHPETWRDVRRALDKRIEVLIKGEASQLHAYLSARRGHFDAILVCRPPNMEMFLDAIGAERDLLGNAKLIYDAEALFVTRILQQQEAVGETISETERHRMTAREVTLTRLAQAIISVSPSERDVLQDYGGKQVYVLGHALDDQPLEASFDERDEIVFLGAVGEDDSPNADSVRWFTSEIQPLIQRALQQDIRLKVIGRNGAPTIQALDGESINAVGMVENLSAALSRARIMVVPTRFAAGIPHKVHQAAMLGIPMVVTDVIFDQLGWVRGREVQVASGPQDFAEACVRLFSDRILWEETRANALEKVRADCDPARFTKTIREIVREIPLTSRRSDRIRHEYAKKLDEAQRLSPPEPNTSRPAEHDYAVAVPFGYLPRDLSPRVGVMCHIFHPALSREILFYLRNIETQADLLLSTDTEEKRRLIEGVFSGWERGRVEIRVVPNLGRDIAPKLVGFADCYQDYDLVLHLHSKLSNHADFLTHWRSFLFENLTGSPQIVRSIFEAFAQVPDLGIVASQHYEGIRRWIGWNGNFGEAQSFAKRMGFTLSPTRALDFPSGSMFWGRPAALKPLLDLNLAFEEFPTEDEQVDHTPAHAIERLFFFVCEQAGYSWMKIGHRPIFMESSQIVQVSSPEALSRFMAEHGVALTGSTEVPHRSTPAPMMTRVPPGLRRRLAERRI